MKNLYKFLLILPFTTSFAGNTSKNTVDIDFERPQQELPQVNAYHTVALTGFNHDVVADGTGGNANTKTTTTIDFSNEYFSADFVPNSPYEGVPSAAVYGGGLPSNGTVVSAVTPSVTYQMAPFSGNNTLLIRPLTTTSGTLSFVTPYKAASVYILWVATESQASTVGITVNFSDGTTQAAANQIAYDWVGGSSNIALSGLSRVGSGTTQWAQLNQFSESGACKLFEKRIDILAANQTKTITGVSFSYSPSGDYQSLAVFAISVFGEENLGVATNIRNAVAIYPNPSSDVFRIKSDIAVSEITVMNNLGQEIKHSKSDGISLADFDSGIYFLKIKFENDATEVRRIVKR